MLWYFLLSLNSVCNVFFLKVAAVDLMKRHMLWEAGHGPGGSSLTSRGMLSLVSAQCSHIPQKL